jgi:hypothetical protein
MSAQRLFVTLFALLAFSLQCYITQTHIHLAPDTVFSDGKAQPKDDKFPANGDPAKCPICQESLHAGQYVTPSAAALLPPSAVASVVTLAANVVVFVQAASHGWRSRAPPAH